MCLSSSQQTPAASSAGRTGVSHMSAYLRLAALLIVNAVCFVKKKKKSAEMFHSHFR